MRTFGYGVAAILLAVPATAWSKEDVRPVKQATPVDVGSWIGPNNYPPEALRAGEQGRVVVIVSIDATGHPTACRVDVSIGPPSLERGTCATVLANGKFEPARDAKGRAIASELTMPVRWVIPIEGENRQPSGPLDFRQVVTIGADDTIMKCEVFVDGRPQTPPPEQCGGPYANPADIRGRLNVTGSYRLRMESVYRNGDTPPPSPPIPTDGRLLLSQEARLTIDAEGTPSACTFAFTGGEQIEQARRESLKSICDTNPRFFPAMTKDGMAKPAKVLVATLITLLPPAN